MRELYLQGRSIIHQLDARVKVIFTLAFILFLNLTPHRAWPAYILFLVVMLVVELLSRLGLGFVHKRAIVAAPFVLAALPLIFTGPPPRVAMAIVNGLSISFSIEGIERFVSIAIKMWISIQAAILLTATTTFPDLLGAFQQLKVPKLFIAIVGLMWRYLFVIGDEAIRMLRARTSRSAVTPGARSTGGPLLWRARVTGGMAGSLFLRSIERSDRVYAAMLSRGFNGDLPKSEATALPKKDRSTLLWGILLLALLWVLGLLTGG